MNATLLKRLFSAVQQGSDNDVMAVCKYIVEDEKRLGHGKLALDLEKSLEAAVKLGAIMAKPGMVVSLTPACASFDMFTDFEARGAEFRRIVSDLQKHSVLITTGGRYE